jgi:cell division septum initiation protein DivIVA
MQQHQQELNALRARVAELERELQEKQQHRISHKNWIRDNLEEAQQIIDNIVGIKGITEDPLKVAAELEAHRILTPHTDTTNTNVIAANTNGTLGRQIAHPPHEELYGY